MTTRRKAVLNISLAATLWGVPALFIHYFARYLDADTQNFWRYLSALTFLYLFGWWSGERLIPRDRRVLARIAATAAILTAYQVCFTLSLYHAMPALVSLLIQLELIVAIALSCLFFADERRVARSPWFILGASAALAGAVGMVVFSREFTLAEAQRAAWDKLAFAVVLVTSAAALWGAYSVAVKWCVEVASPFPAFTGMATGATAVFLILSVARGNLGAIATMPPLAVLLVFLSGVGCIAIAQVLYARAIQQLGVAVCNTVILSSPVVAALASRIIFDERLTGRQVISALVLLGGAAAAIQARNRGRPQAVMFTSILHFDRHAKTPRRKDLKSNRP
jgi:drug/metabolite transporter (DMT)-like permease